MAIQVRRGQEANFDPSKMLPGEWAVSTDTRYVRMCFAPGIVVRMATYESFEADMAQIKQILSTSQTIQQVVTRLASEVKADTEIVVENTALSKQYMEQAKTYAENASAVTGVEIATKDRAGLVKGGENTIAEDGTLELSRKTTDRELVDSYAGGLKINEVDGASEQAQYSGKNSLKCTLGNMTHVGVTITNNGDGTYTLNGTATATVSDIYLAEDVTIKAGTYKVTGYPTGATGWIQLNHSAGAITSTTFTLSADTVCDVRLGLSNGVSYNNVILKPMITTDTTATYDDFEPYVGGNPSPSPEYPQPIKSVGDSGSLEIKTVGKNIFDPINTPYVSNLAVGDYLIIAGASTAVRMYYLPCKPNTKYSYTKTVGANLRFYSSAEIPAFGVKLTTSNTNLTAKADTITTGANDKYIVVYPLAGAELSTVSWEDVLNSIQLEEGEATDFVPYQSNSITIPLSEPLRQYDKIVKQDGVWGVERGPEENTLDENMNWYASSVLTGRYTVTLTNVKSILLCDQAIVGLDGTEAINQCFLNSSGSFCINTDFSTLDEWKAHLAEKPLKVVCILATPTFEPFDTDTQIAINSLVTYDGVTYVSTNSEIEPVIEVEYGTSRVGGYALEALNTANRNELHISALTQLTNSISNTIVEREE